MNSTSNSPSPSRSTYQKQILESSWQLGGGAWEQRHPRQQISHRPEQMPPRMLTPRGRSVEWKPPSGSPARDALFGSCGNDRSWGETAIKKRSPRGCALGHSTDSNALCHTSTSCSSTAPASNLSCNVAVCTESAPCEPVTHIGAVGQPDQSFPGSAGRSIRTRSFSGVLSLRNMRDTSPFSDLPHRGGVDRERYLKEMASVEDAWSVEPVMRSASPCIFQKGRAHGCLQLTRKEESSPRRSRQSAQQLWQTINEMDMSPRGRRNNTNRTLCASGARSSGAKSNGVKTCSGMGHVLTQAQKGLDKWQSFKHQYREDLEQIFWGSRKEDAASDARRSLSPALKQVSTPRAFGTQRRTSSARKEATQSSMAQSRSSSPRKGPTHTSRRLRESSNAALHCQDSKCLARSSLSTSPSNHGFQAKREIKPCVRFAQSLVSD